MKAVVDIARIDHIVLRTTRIESMIAFYRDVLGCEVERTLAAETGLVQLRAGDALIDLVAVDSHLGRAGGPAPTEQGNNLDHFCLQIRPVEQAQLISWLQDHDAEPGKFEIRYGAGGFGPSVYIRDPDGNTIELRFTQDAP